MPGPKHQPMPKPKAKAKSREGRPKSVPQKQKPKPKTPKSSSAAREALLAVNKQQELTPAELRAALFLAQPDRYLLDKDNVDSPRWGLNMNETSSLVPRTLDSITIPSGKRLIYLPVFSGALIDPLQSTPYESAMVQKCAVSAGLAVDNACVLALVCITAQDAVPRFHAANIASADDTFLQNEEKWYAIVPTYGGLLADHVCGQDYATNVTNPGPEQVTTYSQFRGTHLVRKTAGVVRASYPSNLTNTLTTTTYRIRLGANCPLNPSDTSEELADSIPFTYIDRNALSPAVVINHTPELNGFVVRYCGQATNPVPYNPILANGIATNPNEALSSLSCDFTRIREESDERIAALESAFKALAGLVASGSKDVDALANIMAGVDDFDIEVGTGEDLEATQAFDFAGVNYPESVCETSTLISVLNTSADPLTLQIQNAQCIEFARDNDTGMPAYSVVTRQEKMQAIMKASFDLADTVAGPHSFTSWFTDNIVKPAAAVGKLVWNNVLKPVASYAGDVVHDVAIEAVDDVVGRSRTATDYYAGSFRTSVGLKPRH